MMNSISPVLTEKEVPAEQVIALGQDEYYPIIGARIIFAGGLKSTVFRFRFSDMERKAIAEGADLILSQPHHSSVMPMGIQLAFPNEYPLELP
jgi:hypothetical protein